ncbi:MAG TPA: hypothetical protein VID19_06160 [Candidatus Eremiobacteraceae bacterium]|jgi:hypothetical protein
MMASNSRFRLLVCAAAFALLAFNFVSTEVRGATAPTTEGCMNQWVFNGVWRVKVTKVEPYMDGSQQVGWQVTESWRNGTSQEIAPGDTLLKDQVLALDDGSSIKASDSDTNTMSMGVVASHSLSQAAQFTYAQVFRAAALNPTVKPKAVTILFDGGKLAQFKSKPQFTTSHYNFHIKLDCTASGTQSAQGGSFEIPAVQGCMNQWMSNGVWRMRVTATAPYPNDGGPQTGWKVTEDWTSLAHQSIAAGDTFISIQQLVLGNGDTLTSDAGVSTSGSFYQLAGHVFAPGSSFTYQQLFVQIPFDTVDKPVKLIVTFDAATERKITYRPQYKVNPPNFRISLECPQ